ncbi:hypothetical protein GCM10027515_27190 [Schumannella luteola]|uniref:ABC-type dipeptide/oligopeptide/nickel transport system permease subunit n=1 Tax=Schumannella luteola TaxID=472059 RepID=A0A852YAG9_9MICO|nr:hypothetical protein [Schumannella luteola]NYG99483.1 ABC-type dipeptide/oligopeptide/nickel transport system permease subunit [Schumannella luteola]TPX03809.1 hypothetical protein FJ656_14825 [Schumannella luteola]
MSSAAPVDPASQAPQEAAHDDQPDLGLGIAGSVIGTILAAVIGAFVGAVTTVLHRQWIVGGIPLGLLLAIVLAGCLLAGFRFAFDSRLVAGGAALGVLGATALLALRGPGGSVLVVNDALGWTWSIAPTLIALVVLAWPRLVRRPLPRTPRAAVSGGGFPSE